MNAFEYYRRLAGLSQQEAAAKIGVVQSTISIWERGENKPSAGNLVKMAEAYNVATETLLANNQPVAAKV